MTLRSLFFFLLGWMIILSPTAAQVFSREQIVEDMTVLRARLDKFHPNPYRYISRAALDSVQQEIVSKLPDSVTKTAAYVALAKVMARVQDGHTGLYFPKHSFGKKPKTLPLFLRNVDNSYFLAYNATADTTWVRATEILAVAGKPVKYWTNLFEDFIGDDADNPYSNAYYPLANFGTYLLRILGPRDSVEVAYRLPYSNEILLKYLKTQTTKESIQWISKRYPQAMKKNFRYTVLDSTKRLAVLEISSFLQSGNFLDLLQFKFSRSLNRSFAQIRRDSITNLVLDFRGNGGGFIPNITRLMRYVSREPFGMMDSVAFKRSAFWQVAMPITLTGPLLVRMTYRPSGAYFVRKGSQRLTRPRTKTGFDGQLTVLMDGGSYSATTFTIGLLADQQRAQFIGTRPGGIHWGSFAGTWQNKKLPNTHFRTHIPLFQLTHRLPNQIVQTPFVEPDFWVQSTPQDFLNRRDGVLDFVKQWHGVSTAKPQNDSGHPKNK